jgi:hypothetical protein
LTEDIFARSHRIARDKAERIDRESEANSISIAKHQKVKADAERRKEMEKPTPKYKPTWAISIAAAAICAHAYATPPPATSDDYKILAPYAKALRELTYPGTLMGCCDQSECRPVEWQTKTDNNGTHYQAFIRKLGGDGSGFDDGTGAWEDVPDNVVIEPAKRQGLPIATACWLKTRQIDNHFLCFTPGSSG